MRTFGICTLGLIMFKVLRWIKMFSSVGETRNEYVRQPKGERPVGKPRYRWEDNVKHILQMRP